MQKKAMGSEILEQLAELNDFTKYTELMAFCSVMFYAFLRQSELRSLTPANLKFLDDGSIFVNITNSKTDQTGKSVSFTIPPVSTPYSPHYLLKKHLQESNVFNDAPFSLTTLLRKNPIIS